MAKKSDGQPSKMSMVREALQTLGESAKPLAIQAHIKEKFDLLIPPTVISSYKNNIKKGGVGKPARRAGRPGRPAKVAQATMSVSKLANDIAVIKDLVSRLGVSEVHGLVDVLSK
jgi:hypothetical protein